MMEQLIPMNKVSTSFCLVFFSASSPVNMQICTQKFRGFRTLPLLSTHTHCVVTETLWK